VNLADAAGEDFAPAFSPDGRSIAFSARRADGDGIFHLFVMNADGSGEHQITFDRGDFAPAWSPDGRRIAFMRATGIPGVTDDYNIFSVRADGSDLQRLTNAAERDRSPNRGSRPAERL